MKKRQRICAIVLLAAFTAGLASAEELYMYPNKGQTQEQLEKDKFECYVWAKDQTGFDPLKLPDESSQASSQSSEPRHSVAGGAVRGGIGGALLGAGLGALIRGRRGFFPGALVGGAAGSMIGGTRQSEANRREAEQERVSEQERKHLEKRDNYERAFQACIEGRGYTVK